MINRDELLKHIHSTMLNMSHDGVIDMGAYRKKYKKEYAAIFTYFNTVENVLEGINLTAKSAGKERTLRDRLALHTINTLRKKKMSYDDIAYVFGVSRQLVHQLHKSLTK